MKSTKIVELSLEEMDAKEAELAEEFLNLRFQKESGQLTNTSRLRVVRKDIARIKTIRNQKMRGNP